MNEERVCAIVITFHPDEGVLSNLRMLRTQVRHLVVVDNGSLDWELEPLHALSRNLDFTLIDNRDNLGIATALNIGVRWAQSIGAEWVLLFDQDSSVTPGFTEAMLCGFNSSPWGDRLGILVPRYIDAGLGLVLPCKRARAGGLEFAMTSGSLIRLSTFERHGFFVDELFIDAVDLEYSLRLRRAGYLIEECSGAILHHRPGSLRTHPFKGQSLFKTANYSPLRRYYQQRNLVWVVRRYWRAFPSFFLSMYSKNFKTIVKTFLGESEPLTKCYYVGLGIIDGLREHMGKASWSR
jgi:rhamnosyltransferase